jgi:hypothetical protein
LAKNGSFGFAKGRLVCRAKPNVPFVRLAKIELKKCAVGKIKNTEGLTMSVGLLVVRLKYGLYVGHLSKWFVFVS